MASKGLKNIYEEDRPFGAAREHRVALPRAVQPTVRTRTSQSIGRAVGFTALGVNLARFPPGAWSSQRHWHSHEDEFMWVVEGELVLVTDDGEETFRAGDCAGFKAGDANGHHFINRSDRDAVVLQVSNKDDDRDRCVYPDIDMIAEPGEMLYRRRDGTPYGL